MDVDQIPSGDVTPGTETEPDAPQAETDALQTLQHRLNRSQAAQDTALQELRAVMTDTDARHDYGIDTTQI